LTKACGKCFPFILRCQRRLKTLKYRDSSVALDLNNTLILALENNTQHCLINVLQIPFNIQDYTFQASTFLASITVEGKIFPKLVINWPQLRIEHKHAALNFSMPAHIRINWRQAALIKNILQNEHHALFYLLDPKDTLTLMRLQDSNWERPSEALISQSPQDRPPLYPVLNRETETTRL